MEVDVFLHEQFSTCWSVRVYQLLTTHHRKKHKLESHDHLFLNIFAAWMCQLWDINDPVCNIYSEPTIPLASKLKINFDVV